MLLRLIACVVGGVVTAGAFEPVGGWPGLLLGLVPFFWATHQPSVRRGLVLGWVFGATFLGIHLLWLRSVGWDAWALLAGLEAAFFGPLGAAYAVFARQRAWPLLAGAGWVCVETVRSSWPFGGMPWGRLAFGAPDSPWAPGLAWYGASGVALLLAITAATLVWAVSSPRMHPARVLAALAGLGVVTALPFAASAMASNDPPLTATVAVIQGNIPGDGTNVLDDYRGVTHNHRDATVQLARDVAAGREPRPDLVIWPENSTAIDPFLDVDMTTSIETAVAAIGAPILVGAIADDVDTGKVLNQGIVWWPDTGAGDRYTKHHPVPFGEYIPWRDVNPLTSRFERFAMISRDMSAGTGADPLHAGAIRVSDAMCFDIAFDDVIYPSVRNGGQILAVQTSNATYINTEQIAQQFEISRSRAIESGRWTAIAATNGVTGIVRPDGSVVRALPRKTQGYVVSEVALASGPTLGILVAPWIAYGASLAVVVTLLLTLVRARKVAMDPDPDSGIARDRSAGTLVS